MPIQHIVLVKFVPGTTEEQKKSWVREAQKLGDLIPQAKGMNAGTSISDRANQGYEAGLSVVFQNQADYDVYVPHEAHEAFKAFAKPILADKCIFDWEI